MHICTSTTQRCRCLASNTRSFPSQNLRTMTVMNAVSKVFMYKQASR